MSDVYMPGVKSRFNSEKIIEDLMKVERAPKEKTEKNIESLEDRKVWWQDLGRRVTSFRESAQALFSFQNPFSERSATSSNESIITAVATRGADEGEYQFTVKQLAQADRFLSSPLDEKMNIEAGTYGFTVGKDEISFNFRGGTLRELVDILNRQGRGKISASFMTIQPGTRSVLLESKITGAENRLGFTGDAGSLAVSLGIATREDISPIEDTIEDTEDNDLAAPASFSYKPVKAVSTAQDAIIAMEGIEMMRPTNVINDIVPGVTITARGVSDRPERLEIRPDREGVKDAIISLIGNYNRLMAELNVLLTPMPSSTAAGSDAAARRAAALRIVDELAYLDKDEVEDMKNRLGAFSGDTTLTQFRASLQRSVSSPYPTDDEFDLSLLAQIGISTNGSRSSGATYNPARLRGYLDIDEKTLDAAMEQNLPAIRQLFAYDTNGDMLADTGVAYNLDVLSRPFVDKGGIISLKTGTIDSRISQDKRRIDTMERQLAAKEADLKIQYSRMESAYDRMERMSSSLDNFSQRANNNR
jgi:flagellar capping protein FliD